MEQEGDCNRSVPILLLANLSSLPLRYLFPEGIFLNQTTDLNPFKVLGSLVGVALFAIWFYLLCPPLLSISTPKVPLKFRLKSSFSRFKEKIQEIFLGGEEI
jgi:hypothetical protein